MTDYTDLIQHLRNGPQYDAHGVECVVSRQARHQGADVIEAQAARIAELEAAIKRQAGAAKTLRELTLQEVDYLENKDRSEYIAAQTVDGERQANAILTDELDAAQKRITELEAAQAWQPIETAPNDGTEVLAFCPYDQIHTDGPSVAIIRRNNAPCATGWYDQNLDGDGNAVEAPTHWMPLPPAPQEGE